MNIEQGMIDKILSLDDKTFESIAREVASAAGMGKLKTAAMLSDISALKKKISKITPEEATELMNSADAEKAQEVLALLRERGINLGR